MCSHLLHPKVCRDLVGIVDTSIAYFKLSAAGGRSVHRETVTPSRPRPVSTPPGALDPR
jgi:hypothetical protein